MKLRSLRKVREEKGNRDRIGWIGQVMGER